MTDLGGCSLHHSTSSIHGVVAVTGLRRAGPADLDALAALEAACFGSADGAFSRRQLRELLHNPNACWLISPDARAMTCWLKVANGRARWARLYSLAVHPALRGQGWGGRLLEAGFIWMQQEGLTTCRAEVKADNIAARQLYARHGFQEGRPLRDYYAPGVDGVRLFKTIA
jgi:ribosomal protein S18 acetylase RimI-like enzyme